MDSNFFGCFDDNNINTLSNYKFQIIAVEPGKESELSQFDRIYDNMLTSAEINIRNRPCISSYDQLNRPISFLVIPTLEDLKSTMFEAGDLVQEVEYPLKVTTKQDIESASFLAKSPPRTLGHYNMIPHIVSTVTEMLTRHIHGFTKECISPRWNDKDV